MSGRTFVDTNVFVYAHDRDAGVKHAVAAERLRALWVSRDGVMSTQVLQEFYVNVTRKIPRPLRRAVARQVIETYRVWRIERADVDLVLEASAIEQRHQLSFWDAMIVAAAVRAGAERLLSEDLNDGQQIEGVLVENPFARRLET